MPGFVARIICPLQCWGEGQGGRKEDGKGECVMSTCLRPLTFVPIDVGILKT